MKRLICAGVRIIKRTPDTATEIRVIRMEAKQQLKDLRADVEERLNDLATQVRLGIL